MAQTSSPTMLLYKILVLLGQITLLSQIYLVMMQILPFKTKVGQETKFSQIIHLLLRFKELLIKILTYLDTKEKKTRQSKIQPQSKDNLEQDTIQPFPAEYLLNLVKMKLKDLHQAREKKKIGLLLSSMDLQLNSLKGKSSDSLTQVQILYLERINVILVTLQIIWLSLETRKKLKNGIQFANKKLLNSVRTKNFMEEVLPFTESVKKEMDHSWQTALIGKILSKLILTLQLNNNQNKIKIIKIAKTKNLKICHQTFLEMMIIQKGHFTTKIQKRLLLVLQLIGLHRVALLKSLIKVSKQIPLRKSSNSYLLRYLSKLIIQNINL